MKEPTPGYPNCNINQDLVGMSRWMVFRAPFQLIPFSTMLMLQQFCLGMNFFFAWCRDLKRLLKTIALSNAHTLMVWKKMWNPHCTYPNGIHEIKKRAIPNQHSSRFYFLMNWSQTYTGTSSYVGWMRGPLECNNSHLSLWIPKTLTWLFVCSCCSM